MNIQSTSNPEEGMMLLTNEQIKTIEEYVDRHYENPLGDVYLEIAKAQLKKVIEFLLDYGEERLFEEYWELSKTHLEVKDVG